MALESLEEIAAYIVEDGRGILAADESNPTCGKRFDSIGVESTEDNRRDYREMLFRAEGVKNNVGGVISTAAALHLMVTLRNGKILEHFNDFVDSQVKNAGSPYPEVVDGFFEVPEGPGWGVDLNFDFIESNPPESENGVILDPGLNMFRETDWHKRF